MFLKKAQKLSLFSLWVTLIQFLFLQVAKWEKTTEHVLPINNDYTNVTIFIKMTLNSRQTVNKENTIEKE